MTPRARIIGGTVGAMVAIAAPMGVYFEGVFPVGYADPVGIATDCIGETEGARVGVQRHTYAECLARYDARLAGRWEALSTSCIHHDVTVHEAAAIVSWADNIGIYAACTSTLVRMLNAGARAVAWCAQMLRWTKATLLGVKIELPGLVKRRRAEHAMCLGRDWRQA